MYSTSTFKLGELIRYLRILYECLSVCVGGGGSAFDIKTRAAFIARNGWKYCTGRRECD